MTKHKNNNFKKIIKEKIHKKCFIPNKIYKLNKNFYSK